MKMMVTVTIENIKELLDSLEKCIDDPHVALHKNEAKEVILNFLIDHAD